MISFRARHRQVVRRARRDQIRAEVRAGVELLALCEAGETAALARSEETFGRLVAAGRLAEPDYPEPLDCEASDPWPEYARHLEAVAAGEEPGYFGLTPERARAELSRMEEPDREPGRLSWARRFGESDRAHRRRCSRAFGQEFRATRPVHRRALLLARGYWDAGHELPERLRRILLGEARDVRAELSSPRAVERIRLGKAPRPARHAPGRSERSRGLGRSLPILRALLEIRCAPARSLAPPPLAGARVLLALGPGGP